MTANPLCLLVLDTQLPMISISSSKNASQNSTQQTDMQNIAPRKQNHKKANLFLVQEFIRQVRKTFGLQQHNTLKKWSRSGDEEPRQTSCYAVHTLQQSSEHHREFD